MSYEVPQKLCKACNSLKPFTDFYPKIAGDYSRVAGRCKPCYKATYNRKYRAVNAERPNPNGLSGHKLGGIRAKETNLKYDPDFYKRLGKMGGSTPTKLAKGFAAQPKWKVSEAGKKGGATSRRGKKAQV